MVKKAQLLIYAAMSGPNGGCSSKRLPGMEAELESELRQARREQLIGEHAPAVGRGGDGHPKRPVA
jgi:hypothetical protein